MIIQEKFNQKNLYAYVCYFFFVVLSLLVNSYIGNNNSFFHKFLFIGILLFLIYCLANALYRKNSTYVIFFGFILSYCLPYYYAVFKGLYISFHHQQNQFYFLTKNILLYLLFLLPFCLYLDKILNNYISITYRDNCIIFYALIPVFLFCWMRGLQGESILKSLTYSSGDIEKSSLYEYALIILFLLLKYSGKKKIRLFIFFVCSFLYIVKDLLFGGRIECIMLILMIYILFLKEKISFKSFLLFGFLGIYILKVIEQVRYNIMVVVNGNILDILNPFSTSEQSSYLSSNAGDVFWAGERLLHLMKEGYLTNSARLEAGVKFFMAPFISIGKLGELGNISTYKRDIYTTGGGGLVSSFFYTFYSYFGVIVFSFFISKILSLKTKKEYVSVYQIFILITLPRWFAYYPIQLIKMDLIAVLFVYILNKIDYLSKYIIKGEKNEKDFN